MDLLPGRKLPVWLGLTQTALICFSYQIAPRALLASIVAAEVSLLVAHVKQAIIVLRKHGARLLSHVHLDLFQPQHHSTKVRSALIVLQGNIVPAVCLIL